MIDIVPTIYEATGITPPTMMDGVEQKPLEGISLRLHLRQRERPDAARHAVFRAGGQPGDL